MDDVTVQRLALSWMRRRQWENQSLAGEIVSLLGQAMGNKKDGRVPAGSRTRPGRISGAEMLGMMGVEI